MKQADIKKLGRYDIVGELGKGAMGVVYKGFDPGIERHVALKTVRQDLMMEEDPDATRTQIARFKREAQAAGRMTHPNIVAIYEYGEDGDTAYIAMEFIEGRSLKDYFDAHERFDVKNISRLMGEMLGALDYSHRHGIVHRDIKPANIMLTQAGDVKITDFGIARVESSSLTQAGAVLGTPSYMSPEQFMGQQVDARSDIFSAGGVLYQLLTGEKPFTGSLTTIMHRVLHGQPEPPSVLNVQIPRGFDAVVAKAMAKRPDERYQNAAEFAEAVRAAAEGRLAPPPPPAADTEATFDGTVLDMGAFQAAAPAPAPATPPPVAAPVPTATPAGPPTGPDEEDLPAHALIGDSVPRRGASPTPAATPAATSAPTPKVAPAPAAEEAPAGGGGKGKVIAIAAAVLLAVGGGAGWMVMGGGKSGPEIERPARPDTATDSAARQRDAEERAQAQRQRDAEERARAQRQRDAEEQAQTQRQREAEERARAQRQREAEDAARQQQTLLLQRQQKEAEERTRQEALLQQQRDAEEKARQQQALLLQQQQQKEAEEKARQEALLQQQKEAEEKARQQQLQVAMTGAALGQMRGAFARLNCALLKAESQPDGSLMLSGISGDPAAETQARSILEAALPGARYTSRVETASRSMCDPLAAVARPRERNLDQTRPVNLRPGTPGAVFRDGENLVFTVEAPSFAAHLQVDYFTLDGSVVHLFPNGLERDNRLPANGERQLGASASGRTWKVGQPFGRELITVIASAKPLFTQTRPEAEGTGAYLADLRRALEAAAKAGNPAPVAAGLFITTQAN